MPSIGGDDDVLQRRHLAPQPDVLECPGNAATGDLMPLDAAQRLAVEHHRTRGGPVHTGDRVEAGGLAGAVGPDEAEDLTALDAERDRVQGGEPAEFDRQILGFEQGFALSGVHLTVQRGQFLVDDGQLGIRLCESCRCLRFVGAADGSRARFP